MRGLMGWLASSTQGGGHSAFPGFYAPVGYDVVLLEVFAILIFACAIAYLTAWGRWASCATA